MASRKDQTQAYFFLVGRLVAGLLHGEPDTQQRPNRRPSVGTAIGLLVAVLIAAGFGIYGLFRPGGTNAWRKETGSVIMVRETGARYIQVEGMLRPILNYASARLVLGNGAPITTVSRDSLSGVPVGPPIGIPGAPDGLPAPGQLYQGPWTVCARQPGNGVSKPRTVLLLDDNTAPELSEKDGLLVSTPDNVVYLAWQGRRFRIASAAVAFALGYGARQPIPVTPAWINPVPSGRDLAFPDVAGRGSTASVVLGGRTGTIGRVYELTNAALGATDLFLLTGDGLVALSRTAAALVLADPAARSAYGTAPVAPIPITAAELAQAGLHDRTGLASAWPPTPPKAVNDTVGALPCVRHRLSPPAVSLVLIPADAVQKSITLAGQAVAGTAADELVLRASMGLVVRNRTLPTAAFLINESGTRFPLGDDAAMQALGYAGVIAVQVPAELLALLPSGPVLSTAAALGSTP